MYVFGIDVGGTTVKCGLFREDGVLLDKWEIRTNKANKGALVPGEIAETIKQKIAQKKIAIEEVLGAGIGVPGPVTEDGTVHNCVNIGWGVINISRIMSELLSMPVAAGNDANVAALGEMWQGGAKGYRDVVMVTLGTGVGGGIILDGKIRAGVCGAAGELGHMIVDPQETAVCGCGGHGHLEQYASATGIVRLAKKALMESDVASSLREKERLLAKDVFDAAKEGDAVALSLVDEVCRILAAALGHVAAVVDPQVFVIGGGVSKAGKILTESLKKHYDRNLFAPLRGRDFCLATLGNDAGIYGAAKMILDQVTGGK